MTFPFVLSRDLVIRDLCWTARESPSKALAVNRLSRLTQRIGMAEETLKIPLLCLNCETSYKKFAEALSRAGGGIVPSSISVCNELGRFRIWARDGGAMRTGKHALESKLRDVKFLSQGIAMLLEDLRESLTEGSIPYISV